MNSFDSKAQGWDSPEKQKMATRIANAIALEIDFTQIKTLLDYGAGTGLVGLHFADKVEHLTFMDTSEGMLNVLSDKIKDYSIEANVLNIDLSKDLNYDQKFDAIVTSMALHHISDTLAILFRFSKLLNPNGKLIIVDLEEEDGSFHGDCFDGHNGFNVEKLSSLCQKAQLNVSNTNTILKIKKNDRSYPLFMLVAQKF